MRTEHRHLFVSYSRGDAKWLDRLKVHLRPLVRRGTLDLWDDSRITPGQLWREEISIALARAHIAILLVSADFLASDFIVTNELPPLLHRAAAGGVLIVPVIIGPLPLCGARGPFTLSGRERPRQAIVRAAGR